MHEARLPELTHACIDDRVAGHPALPSFEVFLAIIPREARKLILKGSVRHRIKKVNQLITKLSPADFGEKLINRAGPLGAESFRCCAEAQTCRGEISPNLR